MSDRSRALSRRAMGKMLLALPAAALPTQKPQEKRAPEAPSELAEFLAAHEPGLSAPERDRLKKNLAETEQALAVIRAFELPRGAAPAFVFRPLKSSRG